MFHWVLTFALIFSGVIVAKAEEPSIQILPWNGKKAAISLTFDDGDASQLDVAIPILNERQLKGTFFLIVNQIERHDDWRKALAKGHEIGNHSLDHKHATESEGEEKSQIVSAKKVLQKTFGVPIITFAYPFSEVNPTLKKHASENHLACRREPGNFYLTPNSEVDWAEIPAQVAMTASPLQFYKSWIDETIKTQSWSSLIIHGLESAQGTKAWQPIPREIFIGILNYLTDTEVWVGTFKDVAAYWKGQKLVETAKRQTTPEGLVLTWVVPKNFPKGVQVKAKIGTGLGGLRVYQGKNEVWPDTLGHYPISLDALEVRIKGTSTR